ncbi:adenylate/guanylate cyclase domain-containing protein [Ruegeria pomeroyi]|uniref:Adenylate/guanylate cyclase domain-containing protein n=1 Tax=Ruegeria alba TaxID=2916756 RepID=A0ABS9P0T2_9RHOB|nr:adenylate/guanylate cyclase domain-containing protein [Ruegeria alba]MCE8545128.1 adenylate/guanylate cyclase domain-containing protein [Ruegeria pomeroyi]MCG6560097.1 adenylate/guanylate cyclase domain-containing protein [Ruegeria alba]
MDAAGQFHAEADASSVQLISWLLQRGLEGARQDELLHGYCERLVELGVPLYRLHVAQSAFHPKYGGLGFNWFREQGVSSEEYGYTETPNAAWIRSPLYHLLDSGEQEYRERLLDSNVDSRFPLLNELRERGATDYFAAGVILEKRAHFERIDPANTPEGVLISWTSNGPDGFSDTDLRLVRESLPQLALALKSAANRQMAGDLLQVYLGRDAGRRVLSGEIQRGSLQQIDAVLCYFDLKDFTALTERTPGPELIAMLNDYFGMAVAIIQEHGGNILKFLGDGILAMFNLETPEQSAAAGLDAVVQMRRCMEQKNAERQAQGETTTGVTLALHAGEILYGNIGAENRLDFTVIGPAVNLTVRLSGLHRSVGRNIILSEPVAEIAGHTAHDLVSLGRYMLRGVSEPQELYTIYEAPA